MIYSPHAPVNTSVNTSINVPVNTLLQPDDSAMSQTSTEKISQSTRISLWPKYSCFCFPYVVMSSKYCSSCAQLHLLSCFLSDASNPVSKVLATCALCRASRVRSSKRKPLQPLDPNIQAKKKPTWPTKPLTSPEIPLCIPCHTHTHEHAI